MYMHTYTYQLNVVATCSVHFGNLLGIGSSVWSGNTITSRVQCCYFRYHYESCNCVHSGCHSDNIRISKGVGNMEEREYPCHFTCNLRYMYIYG